MDVIVGLLDRVYEFIAQCDTDVLSNHREGLTANETGTPRLKVAVTYVAELMTT